MLISSSKMSKLLTSLFLVFLIFSAFMLSGFTVAGFDPPLEGVLPPNQGPADSQTGQVAVVPQAGGEEPQSPAAQPAYNLSNVIGNGDFELFPGTADVAPHWQPFHNGQAHFSWYDEQWEEAVHSGEHSQLMEIFLVEGYVPDRVMAIYQTVEVIPNMNYLLTIHALMRSEAPEPDRNQGEYAMDWGIDYRGEGDYYNVENWTDMELTEQVRRGSAALDRAEAQHLFFEQITATVYPTNTNQITLFIRAVKKVPTGTEVNFNVDDVSLIGPYPVVQPTPPAPVPAIPPPVVIPPVAPIPVPPSTPIPIPVNPPAPAELEDTLPDAGAVMPQKGSAAAVLLAALVLVVLGAGAAANLLRRY